MTSVVKILSFMTIKFFVFQLEAFQFSKFHENVAKLDKGNFKKGLTLPHILTTNFEILFSSGNFKRENSNF